MRIRYPGLQNALLDREEQDHTLVPSAWREEQLFQEMDNITGPTTEIIMKLEHLHDMLVMTWCLIASLSVSDEASLVTELESAFFKAYTLSGPVTCISF